MRVTNVRRRGRDRCEIELDGGAPVVLALDILRDAGVAKGSLLGPSELDDLVAEDRAWQLREKALRLLAARPRGTVELRRRLRRDGFDAAQIDPLLERLTLTGLLDDAAFAASFVRERLRSRPRSAALLVSELRRRGIDPATAETAVRQQFHDAAVSEQGLAASLAQAWVERRCKNGATGDTHRLFARLTGFLARRGFPHGLAQRAARAALDATHAD